MVEVRRSQREDNLVRPHSSFGEAYRDVGELRRVVVPVAESASVLWCASVHCVFFLLNWTGGMSPVGRAFDVVLSVLGCPCFEVEEAVSEDVGASSLVEEAGASVGAST